MIDIHVHFFPKNVFHAIWHFFETRGSGLWKIKRKVYGKKLVEALKKQGVQRFTTLVYAHRRGMADYLNENVKESAGKFPELLPFGTLFAGDGNNKKTARKLFEKCGFYGIKLHPFVSGETLDDKRFFPVYEIMEGMGKILICHTGSAPVFQRTDGVQQLRTVLKQFPSLKAVVTHCGAFEYAKYDAIADDFKHVYFDTAMIGVPTEVFKNNSPGRKFFLKHRNRILFGSDFPNIPYAYQEQVHAIRRMKLGNAAEKKIFRENAESLLEV